MILYRFLSENNDYFSFFSSFEMDVDDLFMISAKHFFGGWYIKNRFRTKQKCINNKLKNAYIPAQICFVNFDATLAAPR